MISVNYSHIASRICTHVRPSAHISTLLLTFNLTKMHVIAIIGILIGSFVSLVAVAILVLYFYWIKQRNQDPEVGIEMQTRPDPWERHGGHDNVENFEQGSETNEEMSARSGRQFPEADLEMHAIRQK